MTRHLRLLAAVALPAALAAAAPAHAAFTIAQASPGDYTPYSPVVACPGGFCRTNLKPLLVTDLGQMAAGNTAVLKADLAAQKAAYVIKAFGAPLNISFNITDYEAFNDGTSGGGNLTVDYTGFPGFTPPANLHWIQIVTDNWNITGINGANAAAAMGIGNPENVVDAPGVPSPYYDDASAAAATPFNTLPPHFEDGPSRGEPTAAVPVIDWNATLYLVSDDGVVAGKHQLTIYDGVQWGWQTKFNKLAAALPEPSTWMMLILGFGAVGAAVRRRRAAGAHA